MIEDEFFCLLAANIPYISTDLLAAPKFVIFVLIVDGHRAHPGDGTIDILISRKGHKKMDRVDALKLFTQMEKGEHAKSKDVEYFKVKAFTLEPGPEVAVLILFCFLNELEKTKEWNYHNGWRKNGLYSFVCGNIPKTCSRNWTSSKAKNFS